MNPKNIIVKLLKEIVKAQRREDADDHLSSSERAELVKRYRRLYPDYPLPKDSEAAYLELIS